MTLHHLPDLQRWLQAHCEGSDRVSGGLVVLAPAGPSEALPAAEWPADGSMTAALAAVAQAALQRSRRVAVAPTVVAPDAAHNRVIALPLRAGERTLGAVALAVNAEDGKAVEAMFGELEQAGLAIVERLDRPLAIDNGSDAARVLHLQDTLLRHAGLAEGALALTGDLAPMLGCERVALAVVDGDELDLLAVSNSAEFRPRQELLRSMAAAMQEAIDQDARVVYPAPAAAPACIVLAHADLHARSGHLLASVPLVAAGRPVGALLAEWRGISPPVEAQLALLDSLACAIGPLVALSRRAERGWRARSGDALQAARARFGRRGQPAPKLLALGAAGMLAAAIWLPLPYRVGAPAHVEGAQQRVVAAPMDGFLQLSHVRPGDAVRAGQPLVELASQDLLLEQRRWEGTLAQHENGYAAALARADRANFIITQGKAGEARAQLDLVRRQLARTRLVAPIDGIVIKGDLSQSLGAPVQRGDVLLTLAPTERHRLIVDVDERDIAHIAVGQTGRLALSSLPGDTLPFVVDRVTPVATVVDGRNAFEIEARLPPGTALLRPGLQGVAKIDAGRRSAAWIVGHRAVDWLRLALWSWSL